MKHVTTKPIIFVAIINCIAVGCTLIPRQSLTVTRMAVLQRQILQYARSHNQLPTELTALPKIPHAKNNIKDAWNRILIYKAEPNGDVTLMSYGKDGVVGGVGQDEDIVAVFPARKADGNWSDYPVDWIIAPLENRIIH